MLGNNVQLCLSAYFDYEYIFGDSRILYDILCDMYFVDGAERDGVFSHISSERVRSVESVSLYKRYMRIKSRSAAADDGCDDLINIKSRELVALEELKMPRRKSSTEALSCTALYNGAGEGHIVLLRLLGILQCAGVSVMRNPAVGIRNLTRAAEWNDVGATLALLTFDVQNRARNMDRLYTETLDTENVRLFETAHGVYGGEARIYPESRLLDEILCDGKAKREVYDPQIARVVYTDMLKLGDKRKLVFSNNRGLLAETCELPLDLKGGYISIDVKRFDGLPVVRRTECDRIVSALFNNDMRALDDFKPLCLCSDSPYMLEMYATAIAQSFSDANIVRIDVDDLVRYDLDASKHNIFIASCDEKKHNVYMLFFTGEPDDDVAESVKGFLSGRRRRNVRLVAPDVSLDFGAVLPVCFCDTANAARLRTVAEVVRLAPVAQSERQAALDDLIARKTVGYGLSSLALDAELYASMCEMPTDAASDMLDRAIRANRRFGEALTLTRESVRALARSDVAADNRGGGYGFGGV